MVMLPVVVPSGSAPEFTETVRFAGVDALAMSLVVVTLSHEADAGLGFAEKPTLPPLPLVVICTVWLGGGCPAKEALKLKELVESCSSGLLLIARVIGTVATTLPESELINRFVV